MITRYNDIPDTLFENRLNGLVNDLYKILPMCEDECPTRLVYIESLLRELTGMTELIQTIHYDRRFHSLLNILEFLCTQQYDVTICKQEVFKAINLVHAIENRYVRK